MLNIILIKILPIITAAKGINYKDELLTSFFKDESLNKN